MKSSTADLKAAARENLLGNLSRTVSANMIFMGCLIALYELIGLVLPSDLQLAAVLDLTIQLVLVLIMGVLKAGLSSLYLKIQYGVRTTGMDLFSCFQGNADKAIAIQGILRGIPYLLSVPAAMAELTLVKKMVPGKGNVFMQIPGKEIVTFLIIYLLILLLAAIVDLFLYSLYGMAFFILLDFPERSIGEILRGSRRLLQNDRRRYVRLQISFLPLYLLGILSFGIANLWVMSYHISANAVFYRELMQERRIKA